MKHALRVSILTPSYNQAEYLRQNLLSVQLQDYPNIEHVVVDGGSSDGSVSILEEHSRSPQHPIIWRSEKDKGQSDALNKAVAAAAGEIIGWINSDDFYLRESVVSEAVARFRDEPAVDVLYGNVGLVSGKGGMFKVIVPPDFNNEYLKRTCFIKQPAVFMRTGCLKPDPFDQTLHYGMDYDLWLRLARDYRFRHVHRLWAADRNHPDRKILRERDAMRSESDYIRQRHGGKPGGTTLTDKVVFGIPARWKGLMSLLTIEEQDLLFDHELNTVFGRVKAQLVARNKDLH